MGAEDLSDVVGDPAAFEAFYRRHVARVSRFLARRVIDPHLVADPDGRGVPRGNQECIDAESAGRRLRQAVSVLPENERAVVELVAVDGLSLKDAAAALGIRPGAARVRMYRARRVVRDALGSSENLTQSRPAVRAVPSEIGESR